MVFQPGVSGNPSGKPKIIKHLRDLARTHTEDAVNTLIEVMSDRSQPGAARTQAAAHILDRGYGKPIQTTLEANVTIFDQLSPVELDALAELLSNSLGQTSGDARRIESAPLEIEATANN